QVAVEGIGSYSHPYSQARPLTPTLPDNGGPADQVHSHLTSHPQSSLNPRVRGSSPWRRTSRNTSGPVLMDRA
ncbi:hypothetical protein, partial [Micromonospora coerulea]|uniref:hypothetical protein n=1 Tax=Micromonospora coerulea TaxID=47856 RepID=UPI001F2013E5